MNNEKSREELKDEIIAALERQVAALKSQVAIGDELIETLKHLVGLYEEKERVTRALKTLEEMPEPSSEENVN